MSTSHVKRYRSKEEMRWDSAWNKASRMMIAEAQTGVAPTEKLLKEWAQFFYDSMAKYDVAVADGLRICARCAKNATYGEKCHYCVECLKKMLPSIDFSDGIDVRTRS